MVINYKQLREKREQVKESFRRNEDLTPLVHLAQGIVDAYEISWSCHHRHGRIATVIASITFHADWKQLKGFAECLYLRFLPLPPKQGAAMMSEN
ncbi:TPA: hypothetical protein HIO03_RS09805 [Escherichia coli]|uniref:hypothetical protein n=1 Tax=Escherichia coli TaxID=562 RepID=UPI001E315DAA|nr:hypothetical protein [Escherichia coli]